MNVLDSLLYNLGTIAGIPRHRKISTAREFITIEDESILQPITRWKNGDTREKAVLHICHEIKTVLYVSHLMLDSRHIDNPDSAEYKSAVATLKRVRESLSEAKHGVVNLCDTYVADANVFAHLKPVLDEMTGHHTLLTDRLLELGELQEIYIGNVRK